MNALTARHLATLALIANLSQGCIFSIEPPSAGERDPLVSADMDSADQTGADMDANHNTSNNQTTPSEPSPANATSNNLATNNTTPTNTTPNHTTPNHNTTPGDNMMPGNNTSDPIAHLATDRPILPTMLMDYSHDAAALFGADALVRDNTPAHNPITDAGATLGRVLFYDKKLSHNGTISCGSCHGAKDGFSDPMPSSLGFLGGETARHSMPLINVAYYQRGRMFWDERAATLEEQVLLPIQDEVEMGVTLALLEDRLANADYYAPLFEAAFGDSAITSARVSLALAQFVRSIVSYRSKWDEGLAMTGGDISKDFPNYSPMENRGKEVFFGQHDPSSRGSCGFCHMTQNPLIPAPPMGSPLAGENVSLFQLSRPTSNGLPGQDQGIGGAAGGPQDVGKFKSPSLRNVALTAPYMHDGSLATLAEVVTFYNEGVQDTPALDQVLREGAPGQNGAPRKLNLSPSDQQALVAFLETLSDHTLATDERFANPFPTQ